MASQIDTYLTQKKAEEAEKVTGTDIAGDKRALDVAIKEGTVSSTPGGGGVSSVVTTDVTISDSSWVALPPSPLSGRAGFSIQNQTGFQLKINFSTPAGYVGVIVENGGERFYDANDSAIIYAKAESGAGSPSGVIVEELKP